MAVSLLWATSLSTARYFTALYVTAPPIGRVYFECDRAYNEVQSQRDSHVSCVSLPVADRAEEQHLQAPVDSSAPSPPHRAAAPRTTG